jgi:3-methylcrotonyl-CoA carboxylase alpha subunit
VTHVTKNIFVTNEASTWTAVVDDEQVGLTEAEATFVVSALGDGRFRAGAASGTLVACAAQAGDVIWVGIDGHVLAMEVGSGQTISRPATRDADSLAPLMSATVVKIHVRPGDRVQEGDTLVTLEAMKMEMAIRAPRAGVIAAVHCSEGTLAPVGQPVVTLGE